jgi:hypothetical protein
MIVRFSTRLGAFTMHGDAAVTLLQAMGHSGTVPGAILAADLPAALAQLRAALAAQVDEPPPADRDAWDDESQDAEKRAPPISLRMRAVPLLEMIETAIARDSDLMWERS